MFHKPTQKIDSQQFCPSSQK